MKFVIALVMLFGMQIISSHIDAQGILGKIKEKVKAKAEKSEQKEDAKKDDGNSSNANSSSGDNNQSAGNVSSNNTSGGNAAADNPPSFKVYQNYDFVPGEKILFEDNFNDDQDGEFPAHWKLVKGQAVVNKVEGRSALLLTEGNYAEVKPRMKTENYLPAEFTLEFDFIFKTVDGSVGYAPGADFYYKNSEGTEEAMRVSFGDAEVSIGDFNKSYPDDLKKDFVDRWHHAAIILKSGQMKAYVDQYRICVNPNIDQRFNRFEIDGIGDEKLPLIVTNVKLAEGGGMNIIGQKFTEGKIVTHGITFDVNKSVIRAESMGTLNEIAKLLKDNPAVKFEIGGYTDSDGDDAANLKLSQERAEAVKKQLESMGIDGSRLTARGYGETKPIGDNSTPEGKAANRRVEFVKK